jgi:RsiW-degrading membrane proteinase PrsW (M82 family)
MRVLKAILYCLPAIVITAAGVWVFYQDPVFQSILRWELLIGMTLITGLLLLVIVLFVLNLLKTGVQTLLKPKIEPTPTEEKKERIVMA